MSRSVVSIVAAASLACGLASQASAQCDVYRLDIPDFDQFREGDLGIWGLPGGGNVHCAPTSAMNWLAYITNHGYPEVLAGARDWQSNANYNTVSALIEWLGNMMHTNGGTNSADHAAGLAEWLDMTSPENFAVSLAASNGGYAPSPEEIYECMTAGGLVTVCTTHWDYMPPYSGPDEDGNDIVLPSRYVLKGGGHCVSVARITDGCSNDPRVWFRDPAGFTGDEFTQAQFVTQYLDAEPVTAYYAGAVNRATVFRTMYRFVDDDPERNSTIGAFVSIMPLAGLSANAQQGTISVMNQHSGTFSVLPESSTTHSTPGNAPIIGMGYLPHLGAAAVLTRTGPERGTLYRYRTGTGEFKALATIDSPGDMVIGRRGEIFVASRGRSGGGGGVTVCMADGSVRFLRTGVYSPQAMVYDDAHDRIVLILDDEHGTHVAGTIASTNSAYFTNDYSLTIAPISGLPNVPVIDLILDQRNADGFGGGIYVAAGDINGIAPMIQTPNGWTIDRAHTIALPVQNPRNLQFDSRGRLCCTSNGVAHQFTLTFDGQTTTPVLNPNYKFEGRAVGDIFEVSIGRIGSGDPMLRDQPVIDDPSSFPLGLPECRADINLSGTLTVQDIFDFLRLYFEGSLRADFDNSGTISVQDLFDYLALYFRGC